jgi:hypothetical protein
MLHNFRAGRDCASNNIVAPRCQFALRKTAEALDLCQSLNELERIDARARCNILTHYCEFEILTQFKFQISLGRFRLLKEFVPLVRYVQSSLFEWIQLISAILFFVTCRFDSALPTHVIFFL